jgi:hypothetical protein
MNSKKFIGFLIKGEDLPENALLPSYLNKENVRVI